MDMGEFIAEVRKREYLWNRKKIPLNEKQRKTADEQWDDVARACKISRKTAKCKWRSLRDNFLREMRKVPVYSSGDKYYVAENEKPSWKHFNNLIFLLDSYTPTQNVINIEKDSVINIRLSSDSDSTCIEEKTLNEEISTPQAKPLQELSLPPKPSEDTMSANKLPPAENIFTSIRKVYMFEQEDCESNGGSAVQLVGESERISSAETQTYIANDPPPLAMIRPLSTESTFTSIRKIYRLEESNDLEITAPEDERSECTSMKKALESKANDSELKRNEGSNDENENLAFFRSLLPYMNKLDPVQQLRIRMRFQETLLEEINN